jgi:hypothetical protein
MHVRWVENQKWSHAFLADAALFTVMVTGKGEHGDTPKPPSTKSVIVLEL